MLLDHKMGEYTGKEHKPKTHCRYGQMLMCWYYKYVKFQSSTALPSSSIAVWSATKKKPLVTHPHQEEMDGVTRPTTENWVTAVAAYPSSDLLASGLFVGVIMGFPCSD